MEKKFTKGEWKIEHTDHKKCYANAKLIAAAPELLYRLNSLVLSVKAHPDYIFGEEGDEWHDIVSLAEETINKATE